MKSKTFSWFILFLPFFTMSSCNKNINIVKNKPVFIGIYDPLFKVYPDSVIFDYKSKIGLVADKETFDPKPFKVRLPINIKTYQFHDFTDFGIYYDKDQVIFIKVNLKESKPKQRDTLYSPLQEELKDFIESKLKSNGKKYNIKKIPFNKNRKSVIIKKDDAIILLYNIDKKNYNLFLDYVNTFQFNNLH